MASKLALANSPKFRSKLERFRYGNSPGCANDVQIKTNSSSSSAPSDVRSNGDEAKTSEKDVCAKSMANGMLREAVNRWKSPAKLSNTGVSRAVAKMDDVSDNEDSVDSEQDTFENEISVKSEPKQMLKKFEYSQISNNDDERQVVEDDYSRSDESEYNPPSESSDNSEMDDSDEDYEPEWLSKKRAVQQRTGSRKRRYVYGSSSPHYESLPLGTTRRGAEDRHSHHDDGIIGAKSSFELLRKLRKLRDERARKRDRILQKSSSPPSEGKSSSRVVKLCVTDSEEMSGGEAVAEAPKSAASLEAHFLQHRKRQVLLSDDEIGESVQEEAEEEEEEEEEATSFNNSDASTSSRRMIRPLKKTVVCVSSSDGGTDDDISVSRHSSPKQRHSPAPDELAASLSESELEEKCWHFFNAASEEEISAVPKCSVRMTRSIIQLRPFTSYNDMMEKFSKTKGLSSQLYDHYVEMLHLQNELECILNKCEHIAAKVKSAVKEITDNECAVVAPPSNLSKDLELKPYQLLGLNWEILMYQRGLNAILADEMGLGKTVQVIAFLAHLSQNSVKGPHLIVVPSSTLDNWLAEIHRWCPSLSVLTYYGSIDDRRFIRHEVFQGKKMFDIILSPYSIAANGGEDNAFLRRLNICYAIFDEAHVLKCCQTIRYKNLMKVKAKHRMLLTGTPLQNNLVELISLINFVMPHLFKQHADSLSDITWLFQTRKNGSVSRYEKGKIEQAKNIMKPFFLRRLKSEVLSQLPEKRECVQYCDLTPKQKQLYSDTVSRCITAVNNNSSKDKSSQNSNQDARCWFMELRKVANHPLLLRTLYDDQKLSRMTRAFLQEASHQDKSFEYVLEDMKVMSDFELYKMCCQYKKLQKFRLREDSLLVSGKLVALDSLLPEFQSQGNKVLLFSQFTMVLDILEEYLRLKKYNYLRLDGSTPLVDRQRMINEFNESLNCFIFLLSTRAGGLGINLTAANVIILHDIDYNPYNDRQAEDRCHRVGQTKEVTVIRLIAKDTIDETMLAVANKKLQLEKQLTNLAEDDAEDIESLLKQAINAS